MEKQEFIGKIKLDYNRYSGEDRYSDGDIEDELLRIVRRTPDGDYSEAIEQSGSWPILYHLSPLRGNIAEWLPIGKEHKVLEVGSGCGAITGTLAAKAGSVDCVDLSRRRSLINAYRNQALDNVTIHVGNFRDIEPDLDCDYDFICLIGVFEYGKAYIGGETPYEDFLQILKKHLAPSGQLVIAIENQFGLKYWAGCREDHNGEYFSGLEGYPQGGTARTFTRGGLEKLLQGAGFHEYSFYYPYPDYKFMHTIYSDRYLPHVGELSTNLRNFDRERMLLFDEKAVFDTILREEQFPLFSNSYLVITGLAPEIAYSKYSNERTADKQIRTDVINDLKATGNTDSREIRKVALGEAAKAQIDRIEHAGNLLAERFEGSGLKINTCRRDGEHALRFPFIEGAVSLETLLDSAICSGDEEQFRKLIERFRDLLEYRSELPVSDYDMIFSNILVEADGTWNLIDYEWTFERNIPVKEIAFRAWYCYRMGSEIRLGYPEEWFDGLFGIEASEKEAYRQREAQFQKEVTGQRLALGDLRDRIGNAVISPIAGQKVRAGGEELKYRVQLYPDCGSGFAENTSVFLEDSYVDEEELEFRYRLPEGIRSLRIDPCMFPCLVAVKGMKLDGRDVNRRKLQANGKAIGNGSFVFATEDPGLTLRIPGQMGGRELWVRMSVIRMKADTAREVQG